MCTMSNACDHTTKLRLYSKNTCNKKSNPQSSICFTMLGSSCCTFLMLPGKIEKSTEDDGGLDVDKRLLYGKHISLRRRLGRSLC